MGCGIRNGRKGGFVADLFKLSYHSAPDTNEINCFNLKEVSHYAEDTSRDKDKLFGFTFTIKGRIYSLQAFTKEERKQWIAAIAKFSSYVDKSNIIKITPNQQEIEYIRYGLTEFPESLFKNESATNINFSENAFTIVPPEIAQFSETLKILNLSNNKITSLPDEIGNLINLEELNMHGNCLEKLPDSIEKLVKLQLLWVSHNKLTQLPRVSTLVKLQRIAVAFNQGLSIPDEYSECVEMMWIDISGIKCKCLPPVIFKWKCLQVLEANNNEISEVPVEIGKIKLLRELRLSHNKLEDLPDSIGELSNLQELEISFNDLEMLPLTLGTSNAFIQVHSNPLSKIPEDIVNTGSTAIKNYLKKLAKET